MKQRIFSYLFVFTLLLVLFQYVNSKNAFESYESTIKILKDDNAKYKDSLSRLTDENLDLKYFTIYTKEDALSYFENKGYDVSKLLPFITEELYKLNVYEGDDHPIVPYASMTEGKMMINKVSIVNHKWILTDFTDGKHWGELFLTYELSEDEELKFKVVEYFMYPPSY
ncbi:MAG TPA: hydrolase [Flavobacteriaceae bacterium]|nr:hydrolase [Flavobacteriaceae bacterium]